MRLFYVDDGDALSKQAILTAALRCFARDGVSGTSIRTIADDAGYTNPALFKFFSTKDDLVLYLFTRCYRELNRVFVSAVQSETGFAPRLRAVLVALSAFVERSPDAFFFVQDNLRGYWHKLPRNFRAKSVLSGFRDLIEIGRGEGLVAVTTPIELQVAAVIGFLSQLARMNAFGEVPRGMSAQVDHIEVMITLMLQPQRRCS